MYPTKWSGDAYGRHWVWVVGVSSPSTRHEVVASRGKRHCPTSFPLQVVQGDRQPHQRGGRTVQSESSWERESDTSSGRHINYACTGEIESIMMADKKNRIFSRDRLQGLQPSKLRLQEGSYLGLPYLLAEIQMIPFIYRSIIFGIKTSTAYS